MKYRFICVHLYASRHNGGLWGPHGGASRVGGSPDLSGLALGLGGDPPPGMPAARLTALA
ncbi:hypothetical protein [Mastigocladopsis repens]|uniref:hypothetical protein n=1 Tax=Mastigocladopsis repens TaxID=221287 RepID=UPI0002F47DD5|nr:hypothetical protein [Mastigocladopsis repens]